MPCEFHFGWVLVLLFNKWIECGRITTTTENIEFAFGTRAKSIWWARVRWFLCGFRFRFYYDFWCCCCCWFCFQFLISLLFFCYISILWHLLLTRFELSLHSEQSIFSFRAHFHRWMTIVCSFYFSLSQIYFATYGLTLKRVRAVIVTNTHTLTDNTQTQMTL